MPSGLPWHQVNEVYVPINCNEKFHWVLDVIALKDRRIHVYDSLSSVRNMESINKISKLSTMLPTYLSNNRFFEETSRTDWANLEAYMDKITQRTQFLNEHPFEVEYIQDIMQQECDNDFKEEYHRLDYATLLHKYGIQKAKKGYVIEKEDPPRPRSRIIRILDENEIVSIE
ncbi:hypothetical protein CQW23_32115 [Capsicum baccatum]|uniref:Ubiquitin-like protease family profile domain-containing protein n=1 Tax=Capsicum baccatum TaxID=33114 RepID=A0A2G2V5N2_CAPBA|nr:hypothetical protein CQW23_32115 [Capsicum baccatum]